MLTTNGTRGKPPYRAVLSDLDDSLITSHASGRDRRGWDPIVEAFAGFAANNVRLHIVTLNGAPFVAGICNGVSHKAAEGMLGDVHVGEGNVALVVRDGPNKEWCEIPIIEPPPIKCELDRVRVRHIVAKTAPQLRIRSVGMSLMISYSVEPRERTDRMLEVRDAINESKELFTLWNVAEGGHPHIIDIIPARAANKGEGIAALIEHSARNGKRICLKESAWFGDSDADINALSELTSQKRRDAGDAIGFVATHAGATPKYIDAVRSARCPSFVSHETVAERAVPEMLAEYDRVIGLGVYSRDHTNDAHVSP